MSGRPPGLSSVVLQVRELDEAPGHDDGRLSLRVRERERSLHVGGGPREVTDAIPHASPAHDGGECARIVARGHGLEHPHVVTRGELSVEQSQARPARVGPGNPYGVPCRAQRSGEVVTCERQRSLD